MLFTRATLIIVHKITRTASTIADSILRSKLDYTPTHCKADIRDNSKLPVAMH